MKLKDFVRKLTPTRLLEWNRKRKKQKRNQTLSKHAAAGKSISTEDLVNDFQRIGLQNGDVVLVHSSLSRIGHLEEGPKTLVDALIEVVGSEGTILMPTSPNHVYQLNYIRNTPFFDVVNSPSKTGAITEYFRKLPGVIRSLHPSEPVSALGKNADYFVKDHFNQLTPYTSKSPFYRVSEQRGKILYIGVTLDMAGTNLHTLEDAVDFKFPVYMEELFEIDVIDYEGVKHKVKTKVHNPVYSKKRQCDALIPLFEEKGALKHEKIGEADTLVVDAALFFKVMVEAYQDQGITMYTPKGS
jgi:aminoglycoside 3-N-acetyltransferase